METILTPTFYILNICIFSLSLLGAIKHFEGKLLSLSLLQSSLFLPLFASEYLYFSYNLTPETGELIFFSETVFVLLWLSLGIRMRQITKPPAYNHIHALYLEFIGGGFILAVAFYLSEYFLLFRSTERNLNVPHYGLIYFSSIAILVTVLYNSWKIEAFWRALNKSEQYKYRFLVVGSFMVSGVLAWHCSYRLTFMLVYQNHVILLAALIFSGWLMMSYDVANSRLLNRKIFVSRKIIYSFVFPTLLAAYFFLFGIVSYIMRAFGLEMFFVIKWLLVTFGVVGVVLFGMSGNLRRRGHFFISTHFFNNKYEYRDEWLALSENLQGTQNENEVVEALRTVLGKSLYTVDIFIWIGDSEKGKDFEIIPTERQLAGNAIKQKIGNNDTIVQYLKEQSYFQTDEAGKTDSWLKVKEETRELCESLRLKLITPISIDDHIIGLIGLGAEYTGGKYGYDDFDLLSALGTQTASTLLAIRMSEELAQTREQQAWDRLSAFVLHDIKNAATMLALLQENAPEHIHEPEFQQDMLELVDDTLKRMKRVEERLGSLKEDVAPNWQPVELEPFFKKSCQIISKKIPGINVSLGSIESSTVKCDPDMLHSIMENLLLNAAQAQNNQGEVFISANRNTRTNHVSVKIRDNGPGISQKLLPDNLFKPFQSDKKGGSGIGLWQARKLIHNMNGDITAENVEGYGAQFTLKLPLYNR